MRACLLVPCALFLTACSVFGKTDVETAPYTVLVADGEIELRRYDELVLATTPMPGGMGEGRGAAFGRLFDYITGANEARAKVAMTAPVLMRDADGGEEIAMTAPVIMDGAGAQATMSFVLPAGYDPADAPVPTDERVRIERRAPETVAAIRFSWWLTRDRVRAQRERLLAWIGERGHTPVGGPRVAGYDPPWTLPMFRRNEVLIPLQPAGGTGEAAAAGSPD